MIKLLYITNGINGSGGLERVLSIKASYLAEHYNYKVTILSLNNAHLNPFYDFSSKIEMVSIEVKGNSLNYFISYKNNIQKIVDRILPDVILVCDDGLKGFTIPVIIKTEAKLIYERHVSKLISVKSNSSFSQKIVSKLQLTLMDKLASRFDKFVVLTNGNKKEWAHLRNLVIISNPLSFLPEKAAELKNKQVICVGKICYQKGQDLLLEAWQNIYQKFPEWSLHLYGKENLDFVDTRDLKNNVFYFPPVQNIEEKYLESSIYVMASRFEGFGMVLIEAMACGVSCVSFDCNYGPGDIITNNIDGFLIENGNVAKFADKLGMLMSDEDLRNRLAIVARQSAKRYLPDMIIKQWDVLFKQLINEHRNKTDDFLKF